jgi:hypothetical protein
MLYTPPEQLRHLCQPLYTPGADLSLAAQGSPRDHPEYRPGGTPEELDFL